MKMLKHDISSYLKKFNQIAVQNKNQNSDPNLELFKAL